MSHVNHRGTTMFLLSLIAVALGSLSARVHAQKDPYRDTDHSPCFTSALNPYTLKGLRGECTWYVYGRCLENGWAGTCHSSEPGWIEAYKNHHVDGCTCDRLPEVGSVMCLSADTDPPSGHLAFVVWVAPDKKSWVVHEYNIRPFSWDEETYSFVPGAPSHMVRGKLWAGEQRLDGFIHPPVPSQKTIFNFHDFSSYSRAHNPGLTLVSDAKIFNNELRVCPATSFGRGAAWTPTKINVGN